MSTDPIKHVVVLMLENHSFDQMLGGLKAIIPEIDGVDPAAPGQNIDTDGTVYLQAQTTPVTIIDDPKHDLDNVLYQLEGGNANFVRDYSETYPGTAAEDRRQIMGYYPPGSLGPLHELAQQFTVCDRWFSSVPGQHGSTASLFIAAHPWAESKCPKARRMGFSTRRFTTVTTRIRFTTVSTNRVSRGVFTTETFRSQSC